jgi:hypothetical protein
MMYWSHLQKEELFNRKRVYTNVLKIDLKCPEKYIKAFIFFIFQWIEFKFENVKYISIYLTNFKIEN